MFTFHLPWALEVITCISGSGSNSRFQQNCTQIMLSNFQNIYNLFPCLNNWQNSDILGSQFPIHIVNISGCSTILLTVVLSMTSVHDPIRMHVYQPANNSCLCVVGLAHGSQCYFFSNCCHWNQHVYSTPYMMSSWSFSTLQNEHEFAVAVVFLIWARLFLCSFVQVACIACYTQFNSSVRNDKGFGGISFQSLPVYVRVSTAHSLTQRHMYAIMNWGWL